MWTEGNAFLDLSLTSITGMFHVPNVTGRDKQLATGRKQLAFGT
jgi:hypothetical protein